MLLFFHRLVFGVLWRVNFFSPNPAVTFATPSRNKDHPSAAHFGNLFWGELVGPLKIHIFHISCPENFTVAYDTVVGMEAIFIPED